LRAEAKLQQLQSQPKRITLPASGNGTIKKILRKPGERIVPGTPILELADQSQPYLVVEMPEPLAKRFALGDTIPLSFPDQEKAMGRIANMRRLEPEKAFDPSELDAPKVEANVRLEIDPIDETWPELSFKSKVTVRAADSQAMSRRVN
jgi:pyruvate/2-oxoglutarate dehydrogenase complex dihydrolipoamide acyltransferase (E2) component